MSLSRLRTQGQSVELRALLWFCGVMLLAGSLAPPGYMPGSIASGWLVVLCPEGLPAGFLEGHTHQHHHDSTQAGGAGDIDAHTYCPLGSALDKPVATSAPSLLNDGNISFLPVSAGIDESIPQHRPLGYHPRDPPHSAA